MADELSCAPPDGTSRTELLPARPLRRPSLDAGSGLTRFAAYDADV